MIVETLVVGALQVNCYVIGCEKTRRAVVIDPGDEGERILGALKAAGLQLQAIVNSHGHFDHIGANRMLVEKTDAELLIHEADLPLLRSAEAHASAFGLKAIPSPEPTRTLAHGETLQVGELELSVLHTPGHSPGGICLSVEGHLFSGDALFAGSVGRTDLPGGNHDQLIRGLKERVLTLPGETVVHPGHGPDTTIDREKRMNPYLS